MSDVGDVNRAHSENPEDAIATAYVRIARIVHSGMASRADLIAFTALHNASNVVRLGKIIDDLRAENASHLEKLLDDLDSED